MSWLRVDDGFHHHKKTKKTRLKGGVEPLGLWLCCATWSSDNEEDGFIPAYIAEDFSPKFQEYADVLVYAGFWEPAEKDGDDGWQMHDFGDYNPLKVTLDANRERERERKAEWRSRKEAKRERPIGVPDMSHRDTTSTDECVPEVSALTRPDPTPYRGTANAAPSDKRGTRIPKGWQPDDVVVDAMSSEYPGLDQQQELVRFRDYWTAAAGARGVKLDWNATYRNWIRRSADRSPRALKPKSDPVAAGMWEGAY